jgi:SAM-dependent methyltransferase
MNPRVFQEFEKICKRRGASGSVLEIGAIPSDESLLCMQALKNAKEKIGVSLEGPYKFKDFEILKCNANNLICFNDNRFDTIVCNAMLEHDKFFWKTIAEINRILKPGGLVVIGVPGYKTYRWQILQRIIGKLTRMISPLNYLIKNYLNFLDVFYSGTITFKVHHFPSDYYRFSEQAVEEILLLGLDKIELNTIMTPPRIIGSAIKPGNVVEAEDR